MTSVFCNVFNLQNRESQNNKTLTCEKHNSNVACVVHKSTSLL